MTTTDTNARLLGAFVAFADAVRTVYAEPAAAALTAAQSGNYEPGRSLLASFEDLAGTVADYVASFTDEDDRLAHLLADDHGAGTVVALVPIMSDLCAALDESDPVTIGRSQTRAIELLGADQFFALMAEDEG